jgi:hypothetical protein
MAVHRPELPLSGEHSLRGSYVTITRCRRCGIVIGFGDRCGFCQSRPSDHIDAPGEYVGRHHTEWVTTVDELLIQGDDDDAEFLLWKLVDAAEAESLIAGVPPFERHFTRLVQLANRRDDPRLAAEVRARYDSCVAQARDEQAAHGHRAAG